MSSSLPPDPQPRSVEALDQYAGKQWDTVLHFLVDPDAGIKGISRDAVRTLLHAKLVEKWVS